MRFPRLIAIEAMEPYVIYLRYDDNTSGKINLSEMKGKGVFKWWEEGDNFKKVSLDEKTGAVVWDNKIDMDPDALYLKLNKISFKDWIFMQNPHAQTF